MHAMILTLGMAVLAEPASPGQLDAKVEGSGADEVQQSADEVQQSDVGAEQEGAAEAPPPSAYDRRQGDETPPAPEEEISWESQLVRTVLALLLVVGLIYLLFKFGLSRFVGTAAFRGGKRLKIAERVQLDARHALLIVEVEGQRRLLIGTGEQGVQLLSHLDGGDEPPPTGGRNFKEALQRTESSGGSESSGGAHASD